jgi:hypothetical protein
VSFDKTPKEAIANPRGSHRLVLSHLSSKTYPTPPKGR